MEVSSSNVSYNGIQDQLITRVLVPNDKVGYVVGKGGRTIKNIQEKTDTRINTIKIDDQTYFVINGDVEKQYRAKIEIKRIVLLGFQRRRNLEEKFSLVDASNEESLKVQPAGFDDPRIKNNLFELVSINPRSVEELNKNEDYGLLSAQLSKILRKNKEGNLSSKMWCHFGRALITRFDPEAEPNIQSVEELNNRLLPKWMFPDNFKDVKRLPIKFFECQVKNENIDESLSKWDSRPYKFPQFRRYEYTYLTPTCKELRIKVFMEVRTHESNNTSYQNTKFYEEVGNCLKASESPPYFYVCQSNNRSAVVDILQPHSPLDIRLMIEGNPPRGTHDDIIRGEADILYDYVYHNLKINEDGTLELPNDKAPYDFDRTFSRVCHRMAYSFETENKELFTVILSHEEFKDLRKNLGNPITDMVDIHLNYHEWEDKFKDNTWDPQEIVDKLPVFMKCARSLARTLYVDATVPPEILARGPAAQEAYENALKSGKTKNRRILIMLIGQSCVGKTSLLRSLRGEVFDSEEDSTIGIRLQQSLSVLEENTWSKEDVEEDFIHVEAREVAKRLTARYDHLPQTEIKQRSVSNQKFEEENTVQDQKDSDLRKKENKYEMPVFDKEKQAKSSEKSVTSIAQSALYQHHTEPKPVPEMVTRETIDILQNPEDEKKYDQRIYSTTLDFAGQPVYQATHPVFLSPKGIYILVYNLENDVHAQATPKVKHGNSERDLHDNCPMTNMDHLEFWLSAVASYSNSHISTDNCDNIEPANNQRFQRNVKKFPRVFLSCTHADKFSEEDATKKARKILQNLKRKNHPPGDHVVRAIFNVDNTISGSGTEDKNVKMLKSKIYEEASSLPHMKENIPIRWLRFEKKLLSLVENEHKRYISLEDAKDVALEYQISDANELKTLLNYLHDLKVIIYFEDISMDFVIIDTQWLLDIFAKVITVQPFEDRQDQFDDLWTKLEDEGVLDRNLVEHVWKGLIDSKTTIDCVLLIMEKFSLICRWKQPEGPDIFLVPAMLTNESTTEIGKWLSLQKLSPLVVKFASAHIPIGIFPRFLVAVVEMCNQKWPNSRQPEFSSNFCSFYDVGGEDGDFVLCLTSDMRTITVGVINDKKTSHSAVITFCQLIFDFLKTKLGEMRSSFPWMKNMEFEFCIHCPICFKSSYRKKCILHDVRGCTRGTCLKFIAEKELNNANPRCCHNKTNPNTLIKEEAYCHWFPKRTENAAEAKVHAWAETENMLTSEGMADTADLETTLQSLVSMDDLLCAVEDNTRSFSGSQSQQIVPYGGHSQELMLPDSNVITIAKFKELVEELKPYKLSVKEPPSEIVQQCRDVCRCIRGENRENHIMELRKYLPSGTTGPREDENKLYQTMEFKKKQELTQALCGQDKWKRIAEELGRSPSSFGFLDRLTNPAEFLLEEECKKRNLSVGLLYDVLVSCEANAVADEYL